MTMADRLARFGWWQRATARERAMLAAGAAVVCVAIVGTLVVAPMRDTLAHAPLQRAERKALLVQARERVTSINSPRGASPAAADARAAIERALDARSISRRDATLDLANDRISLTLAAVSVTDAVAVVGALAREGLRATGINFAARADSPAVRAEITFAR